MKSVRMNLFAAIAMSFSLFAMASAQTNQAAVATASTQNGQDAQSVKVTRDSAQAPRMETVENFTGLVGIQPLATTIEPSRLAGARVTFAPGARTAWHTHPLGQTLIVTAGVGWVRQWGGPTQEIRTGDVVQIPPNTKHWHGAAANSTMTHIALTEQQPDGKRVEWMEKVSDAQYTAPPRAQAATSVANPQPRPSQRSIGDFSPKLAEITDEVLYGDVWERPQLAKRDRSLVTVAALIAMNRPDQLRSHMARARANGVTKEELIETITHMAFYAGWPSAISAIAVAKEVFQQN